MKKLVILIFLLSGLFNQSYGQSYYRIKPFADKGNFIYPPHSKLKHSCKEEKGNISYTVKKSTQYQYTYIDNLLGNYYSVLSQLDKAMYHSDKNDINTVKFKRKRFPSKVNFTKGALKIKYSSDKKAFLLQIDYSYIIDGKTESQIRDSFFEVAKDLLIEFQKREGSSGADGLGWPTSISQDIVEKVFELIPIPNQSSLLRYVTQIDNDKSFVLLNPKIKLKVDAVDTLTDENEDWQYRLIDSNLITLTKDNNGNTIQSPFLNFQYKTSAYMPTNTINGKNILQASSSDIQFSSTLNECPFVFLFQNKFKKNSKFSTTDCTFCGGKEWNMFECNSVLYHYKTIPDRFYDSDNGFDKNKINYFSAFGYRNLITPVISIYLNNIPCDIILNTTLRQLRLQHNLPANLKILRLFNGKYKRVNLKPDNDIILLPSDFIKF